MTVFKNRFFQTTTLIFCCFFLFMPKGLASGDAMDQEEEGEQSTQLSVSNEVDIWHQHSVIKILTDNGLCEETISYLYQNRSEYYEGFLQLFSPENSIEQPFPLSLIQKKEEINIQADPDFVAIYESETTERTEIFIFPSEINEDQQKAWHPYFAALNLAVLNGDKTALHTRNRFLKRLINMGKGNIFHEFGRIGLSSSVNVVEGFSNWVQMLKVFIIDPYSSQNPQEDYNLKAEFLNKYNEAEWYVSAFRHSLKPVSGQEFDYNQVMRMLSDGENLGTFLCKFTEDLFFLFSDEHVGSYNTAKSVKISNSLGL